MIFSLKWSIFAHFSGVKWSIFEIYFSKIGIFVRVRVSPRKSENPIFEGKFGLFLVFSGEDLGQNHPKKGDSGRILGNSRFQDFLCGTHAKG